MFLGLRCARCGRVMNVTIARDLQGKPKGFAHVEFSNELEAQNALSLSGKSFAVPLPACCCGRLRQFIHDHTDKKLPLPKVAVAVEPHPF